MDGHGKLTIDVGNTSLDDQYARPARLGVRRPASLSIDLSVSFTVASAGSPVEHSSFHLPLELGHKGKLSVA